MTLCPTRIAKKKGLPARGGPGQLTALGVCPYRPYNVRPNVSDRKTPIWSRVTGLFGQ